MAKVKNPLLSISAKQKFADTIIFAESRGIQIAKKKTDPTNPKTPGQTATREIYGEGVEAWRDLDPNSEDKVSLTRLARLYKRRGNPWQIYFALYGVARKVLPTFLFCHNWVASSQNVGEIKISIDFLSGQDLEVGLTPKFNLNYAWQPIPELGHSGHYRINITNLLPGQRYYFRFRYTVQPYVPPWYEKIVFYSDDFNDGNYNGWTVVGGVWTAVPLYLKGTTDGGQIHTTLNVVPSGIKYIHVKHKHHGVGLLAHASRAGFIYVDINNMLYGYFYQKTALLNFYDFVEKSGGVSNVLYHSTKYDYIALAGSWFHFLVYKNGISVKFKHWLDGTPEPAGWDWEGNCNPATPDLGKVEGESIAVDANGCGYDDIEIYNYLYHPPILKRTSRRSGIYAETLK